MSSSSPQSRDVLVRGTRVRCVELGSGTPLLFLHGWVVNHAEWLDVAKALAPDYRCLLPDLPGCGQSERPSPDDFVYDWPAMADHINDLLTALEIDRATVIGHSMGGGVALALAARHAERLAGLAVFDAIAYPVNLGLKGSLPLLPGIGPFVFKRLYRRPMFHDYFRQNVFNGGEMPTQRIDEYYEDFNAPGGRDAAYAMLMRALTHPEVVAAGLPSIQVKTLVGWGEHDRIVPATHGERMVQSMPDASFEIVRGAGHAANEEQPEAIVQLIRTYLKELG